MRKKEDNHSLFAQLQCSFFEKTLCYCSFYCTWNALSSLGLQIALTQFSISGVSNKISIHFSTGENEVVQHRLQQHAVNRNDEIRKVEKMMVSRFFEMYRFNVTNVPREPADKSWNQKKDMPQSLRLSMVQNQTFG